MEFQPSEPKDIFKF